MMAAWSIIANIATTVGVIASILFAVRAERAAARRAEAAAERTEAAAALSDENANRAIGALEQIAANDSGSGTFLLPEKVRWSMTHQAGDTYLLENTGDLLASSVEVSPAPDSNMIFSAPEVADLQPGEALTFMAARSLATSDSTMTVTWRQGGEEHQWRYPLPPRPRG
jgi:hypothetical protein